MTALPPITPLITAAEGFPALERLVAGAERTVILSFRILDPQTRLRAPELRNRGLETWADLVADASARGVALRILLADFDPLLAQDLHRAAWRAASGFADAVQGDAQILCAPHGQSAGPVWRLVMRRRLRAALADLRQQEPTRLTPVQRQMLNRGPVLRPVTNHQKFAIADGRAVFIGGLDVNERRHDTPDHDRPGEETWHDIAATFNDTDFAGALQAHFADCWNAALACGAPSLADHARPVSLVNRPQSRPDLRLLRTFSDPCSGLVRLAPRPRVTDHETALRELFRSARSSIYVETQFLRHAPLTSALVEAAQASPDLTLTLLLPAAPERILFDGDDGWDARHAHGLQTAALSRLRSAFGPRLALLCPAQPRPARAGAPAIQDAEPVYLHSKLVLVDGTTTVIGSANLNGRSLRWDSEASVLIRDAAFARNLMQRLARKWLRDAAGGDPWHALTWAMAAQAQATLAPTARQAFVLPFPMQAARSFSRRVFGLPDDMF